MVDEEYVQTQADYDCVQENTLDYDVFVVLDLVGRMVQERNDAYDGSDQGMRGCPEQEPQEVADVPPAYTVADPRTVMVMHLHADIASTAVERSGRPQHLAGVAVGHPVVLVLLLVQLLPFCVELWLDQLELLDVVESLGVVSLADPKLCKRLIKFCFVHVLGMVVLLAVRLVGVLLWAQHRQDAWVGEGALEQLAQAHVQTDEVYDGQQNFEPDLEVVVQEDDHDEAEQGWDQNQGQRDGEEGVVGRTEAARGWAVAHVLVLAEIQLGRIRHF